jgi:hypothetical protein
MEIAVGRIIRSSTARIALGCAVLEKEAPVFGSLVKVQAQDGVEIYGLIYDLRMEDDPYVRQMAVADGVRPEVIEDQRRNRQVPIEVSVLVAGYRQGGAVYHWLPPQPPLSLDVFYTCPPKELIEFTCRFDYFRLVLDNRDLPADELLAANLRYAAQARGAGGRDFLLEAGREVARMLALDLARLDALLRRLRM